MTFNIHRGADEIGGSCVEVCSATTRIVIDIGMPLMNPDGSPFDSTRVKELSAKELIKEKILPDIPALYGSADDKETALLISHAHQDHYGLITFVDTKIPVYLGKATHKFIELSAVFAKGKEVVNNPYYFDNYELFTFGDIEIVSYLMDHAAFDAYAFLVKGEGKSLLYTGDFRSHGRKSKLFYKFLHVVPKNVTWLLMEGTSLSRKRQKFRTEEQLENRFIETFDNTEGVNLVYVSGQNIDRLVTVYRSCRQCGKLFVVDFYIATVLSEIAALGYGVPWPSPDFPDIRVFFPSMLKRKMIDRKDIINRFNKYKISLKEIDEKANDIVMTIRPSMDYEIKNLQNLDGGTVIYSMWEGYKESPYTKRFLDNLTSRGMEIITVHTSGHADYYALQKLLSVIKPIKLVPIHTTEGKRYKDIFPGANVQQVKDGKTVGNILKFNRNN
ncbi:MAG: MBL fold metallo-hydrolase [Treponema sp.]|nr:MBL fold metallo-hydrolase [Treponema sp.]